MLLSQLAVAAAFVAISNAAPAPLAHALHEKRDAPATDWVKGARVEGDAILPMRIGLTQTNLDKGYDYLMEVSDPDSDKYGQYWSMEEVHNAFAPPKETVRMVREWLTVSGIHGSRVIQSDNYGWLAFNATAVEAERLLNTEYHEHEHKHSASVRVGCDEYHIPKHIQEHIDYITPGIKLTPVVKRSVKVKRESSLSSKPAGRVSTPAGSDDLQSISPSAMNLPPDIRGCGLNITPPCIKALYQIPNATLKSPGNSLGLYEQGSYFNKQDLDSFYAEYAPYVPQGTYPVPQLIDGANYSVSLNSSFNSGEANIDIDMAYSLIYPQTVTLYQTDDQIYEPEEVATTNLFNTFLDALDGSYCNYTAFGETGDDPAIDPVCGFLSNLSSFGRTMKSGEVVGIGYITFAEKFRPQFYISQANEISQIYPDPAPGGYKGQRQCGVYKPTNVISASYGQAEADLPIKYSKRQCNEFMKLGLQGHSILVASGDYGVSSFPGDKEANGCLGPDGLIFSPQYPSNCPYITSVGATMLYAHQTVYTPESVMHVNLSGTAQNFTTAGGFSNYYGQPAYQKAAVAKYFAEANLSYPYYSEFSVNVNKTKGIYNRIGRGYPDVAANGAMFRAQTGGTDFHFYGSSLASPLFASVLTLINEERFKAGKGPVGFVNPTLYKNPEVLNDITNGTNVGCGTQGFHTARGWDPATGLGTPNYPDMLQLFMSLP
ncbi:hypothetical protein MMC26_006777 [Xylographa opegraphella]|nr:hypothetical protein [Xylographa opegraphella]